MKNLVIQKNQTLKQNRMKQTAVEWLVKYLTLHRIELNNNAIQNVINVAKEMEK
jgi:hypothetical protein